MSQCDEKLIAEALGCFEVKLVQAQEVGSLPLGRCFCNCQEWASRHGGEPVLVWELSECASQEHYMATLHAIVEQEGEYYEVTTEARLFGDDHVAYIIERRISFDEYMQMGPVGVFQRRVRRCKSEHRLSAREVRNFERNTEQTRRAWVGSATTFVSLEQLLRLCDEKRLPAKGKRQNRKQKEKKR